MCPETYICPSCESEVEVGGCCGVCAEDAPASALSGRVAGKGGRKTRGEQQRRSWQQDKGSDGLDLPGGDFDYDDFVAREFGKNGGENVIRIRWYWWITALFLVTSLILLVVNGLW